PPPQRRPGSLVVKAGSNSRALVAPSMPTPVSRLPATIDAAHEGDDVLFDVRDLRVADFATPGKAGERDALRLFAGTQPRPTRRTPRRPRRYSAESRRWNLGAEGRTAERVAALDQGRQGQHRLLALRLPDDLQSHGESIGVEPARHRRHGESREAQHER